MAVATTSADIMNNDSSKPKAGKPGRKRSNKKRLHTVVTPTTNLLLGRCFTEKGLRPNDLINPCLGAVLPEFLDSASEDLQAFLDVRHGQKDKKSDHDSDRHQATGPGNTGRQDSDR